jgi:hypothetical protein
VNPQLNQEQVEAHFRDFVDHWKVNVLPEINAAVINGTRITPFDVSRMFENLWLDWKAKVELDYWEAIGLFDV